MHPCFIVKLKPEPCVTASFSVQETIMKILKTSGEKAPLKYVESIEIEEFTMGMQPPRFHFCHARYNPTRNYLQLEADMGFRSSGFQLVVSQTIKHACTCCCAPLLQSADIDLDRS